MNGEESDAGDAPFVDLTLIFGVGVEEIVLVAGVTAATLSRDGLDGQSTATVICPHTEEDKNHDAGAVHGEEENRTRARNVDNL